MKMMTIGASGAARIMECPGSYHATRGLLSPSSPQADSGSLVHEAMQSVITADALTDISALDTRVRGVSELYRLDSWQNWCLDFLATEVFSICQDHGGADAIIRETPFSAILIDGVAQARATTDLIVICKDGTFHTIEYKTGFANIQTSDRNPQVMTQVLCTASRFGLSEVYAHMLAAGNDRDDRHTWTRYTKADVDAVQNKLTKAAKRAKDPHAPRIPGKGCQYCAAKATQNCPESYSVIDAMQKAVGVQGDVSVQPPQSKHVLEAVTPQEAGKILKAVRLAKGIIDNVEAKAKEMMATDPASIAGFGLESSGSVRVIDDTLAAIHRVSAHWNGLSVEEIVNQATTLSMSKLESAIWEDVSLKAKSSGQKIRKADVLRELEVVLDGLIERKEKAKSIVEVES